MTRERNGADLGEAQPEERYPSVRVYPTSCTSAYCGKGPSSCPTCRYFPALLDFKNWVQATKAAPSDPIWCPLVYVAGKATT